MELVFAGPLFEWRGPAPYHFVGVPSPIQERVKIWRERREEYRTIQQ